MRRLAIYFSIQIDERQSVTDLQDFLMKVIEQYSGVKSIDSCSAKWNVPKDKVKPDYAVDNQIREHRALGGRE